MKEINKLVFTELRVLIRENNSKDKNVLELNKALVDKENLNALGYTLSDKSILSLAEDYAINPDKTPLYRSVMNFEPEITVNPMYPGFPIKVLDMEEEEFRAHQMAHYLSTYGIEEITGQEVQVGWLPQVSKEDVRVGEDVQVVELKVLDYLTDEEVELKVINDLIGRKERLENRELELAKWVAKRTHQAIVNIPFKENIALLFAEDFLVGNSYDKMVVTSKLSELFKHPGDVLDFLESLVILNDYKHFKTSVKRTLVDMLESFELGAIEENLASNRWAKSFLGKGGKSRVRNRNISLIDYLSFNRFSKKPEVKAIVADMKSGRLLSWNQKLELAYKSKDNKAVLTMLAQRPGVFFRQVNRLVKLGVSAKEISNLLDKVASELKTQSIVAALNNYDNDVIKDREAVVKVFKSALGENLKAKEMPELVGKKIYVDDTLYSLEHSKIELSDKFVEGGYIANGLAVKIPEAAKFIRFFTYWNDERRIDIDLHAMAERIGDGMGSIHIGWHGSHKDNSRALVHSGDITHSNAAEYVDIDVELARQSFKGVQFNINSYTGVPFNEIDKVFTGIMLLSEMGQQVGLYQGKNLLFRHDLESNFTSIDYGFISIENNYIRLNGKASLGHNDVNYTEPEAKFSIREYLDILFGARTDFELVDSKDEADVILCVEKSDKDNHISIIDKNFFM